LFLPGVREVDKTNCGGNIDPDWSATRKGKIRINK